MRQQDGFTEWTLQFTNTAPTAGIFPQSAGHRENGEEILPSYWSDNYFSIPAGKSVTVTVSCPAATDPAIAIGRLEH